MPEIVKENENLNLSWCLKYFTFCTAFASQTSKRSKSSNTNILLTKNKYYFFAWKYCFCGVLV